MKEKRNMHLKVQELCDCYATNDPLKEMSAINQDPEKDEAALKWIALAALHGINANAEKISISRSTDGRVKVTAEYRKCELPAPSPEIAERTIQALRAITHIEDKKGQLKLSLGIRDSSMEVNVKVKSKPEGEKVTLVFP